MVRREEQSHQARCTVLLDTRAAGYDDDGGPTAPLEWAVSGAASAVMHLLERGYAVRLLTDTGRRSRRRLRRPHRLRVRRGRDGGPDDGHAGGGRPLRRGGPLRGVRGAARRRRGLLVAFLGVLDAEQAALLGGLRTRSGAAVAFVLDQDAWSRARSAGTGGAPSAAGAEAGAGTVRQLRQAGWTAVAVRPGDVLADLWRHAGRAAGGPRGRRAVSRRRRATRGLVMSTDIRLAVCALIATLTSACALLPLVSSGDWLVLAGVLLAVVSAAGALARRVPLARPLTALLQAAVVLVLLTLVFARDHALVGLLPTPQTFEWFGTLLTRARTMSGSTRSRRHDGRHRADAGRRVLLVGLAVDLLAATFRAAPGRAAAAGPVLGGGRAVRRRRAQLAVVPAGRRRVPRAAAGREPRPAHAVGRVFGGAGRPYTRTARAASRSAAPLRTGRRIGAVALGIAVAVPAALPSLGGGRWTGAGAARARTGAPSPRSTRWCPCRTASSSRRTARCCATGPPRRTATSCTCGSWHSDQFDGTAWKTSVRAVQDVPQRLPADGSERPDRHDGDPHEHLRVRFVRAEVAAHAVPGDRRRHRRPLAVRAGGPDARRGRRQTTSWRPVLRQQPGGGPDGRAAGRRAGAAGTLLREYTRVPDSLPPT